MTEQNRLKQIVEAALLAAGKPLSLDELIGLFTESEQPEKKSLREVLAEITEDYQGRGIEVTEVGNGFRIQVRAEFSPWVSKLWAERPPKYSRALLETLALIAYRQPITRGEIEDIRGVSVSTNIIKTLTEREWVRVVGHRDVPGKPALYATTKEFLDYFNLKSLNELPTLAEIRDLDSINRELELQDPDKVDGEQSEATQQSVDSVENTQTRQDADDEFETESASAEPAVESVSESEAEAETDGEADSQSFEAETDSTAELDTAEVPATDDDISDHQDEAEPESLERSEKRLTTANPEAESPSVALSDEEQTPLKTEIDE
ncbi:MAG: SMC-Scp complex subunit ScpB [Candidatus Thiodiazotropha lotti]|uniref:SMC-Scp complex subunit ScpB n=1 Tax=Candidatus Thiodiazotropha endoloripes TaxID=1818881 RepID=A0A1E2US04_9GAMM|nr:SMC-Scp complex subunit ScpB [Candidatus Thiodiazotropha weberae]MCG7990419.1 SMC-Scp complex subunit ScpB [Candidatus Thiodiazotropha lotti]ODB85912.1 SMC-Scp complex subunit ScpB [Candidatus Thiodiazotropha endoloripes]MCG7904252.1 SMC-Scp complex subunit ScpB [Candidatus Thiodiazotropha weberae]MCG7913515.1 SMC-Scp complex subunit ScpB [Candidatus Thiodiazotropha weberae]